MTTTNQSWDPTHTRATPASFPTSVRRWSTCSRLARRANPRLGCGDGALTIKLAKMGCGVVGVDSSAPQIEAARRLGLDARVVDGARLNFDSEFDAVFSNAAIHWMKPVDNLIAAFGGDSARRTLRRGVWRLWMRRDD